MIEVIKLGGSLYGSDLLESWLMTLNATPAETIVLVPGGGPFADVVREAQQRYGFDDVVAHQMAIVAMQQFGRMLLALSPNAVAFSFPGDQTPQAGKLNIWLPTPALFTVKEIEQSWRVSADSLALWLAQSIQAQRLTLVKSCEITAVDCQSLRQNKIIDVAFSALYQDTQLKSYIVQARHFKDFTQQRCPIE